MEGDLCTLSAMNVLVKYAELMILIFLYRMTLILNLLMSLIMLKLGPPLTK